jgi:hypothetical protein
MSEDVGRPNHGPDPGPNQNAESVTEEVDSSLGGAGVASWRLPLLGLGGVLHLILLVTAGHAWVIGWPGRVWVSLGAAIAIGASAALFRRWPLVPVLAGAAALACLLLIPAYLYGVDGVGLPIALVPFPAAASVLFLLALSLAAWIFAGTPHLPIWARLIPIVVAVYAAVPAVMGLMEGIPFGEVLVGLWTWPYWIQGAWIGAAVLLPMAVAISLRGVFASGIRPSRFSRSALVVAAGGLLGVALLTSFEMNVRGLGNLAGLLGSGVPEAATMPPESGTVPRGAQAQTGDDRPSTVENRRETLQHLTEMEEGFANLADVRSPSTIESLVSQLGTDPEALLGWVRDSTQWVPYRGALRGSSGVLGERVGNSLDRAWLLYELLRFSGTEARLARGTLAPAEARSLLEALAARGVVRPSQGSENIADVYSDLLALDREDLRAKFRQQAAAEDERKLQVLDRVAAQTSDLLGAMSGVPGGSLGQELPDLAELVREHWWVQIRAGSEWIDLHPSSQDFPGISIPPDYTIEPSDILDLDPGLLHRVDVRLVLEAWTGGHRAEDVVLEYSMVPANVGPVFLTIGHAPVSADIAFDSNEWEPEPFEKIEEASAWQPVLLVDGSEVMGETFSWPSTESAGGGDAEPEERPAEGGGSAGLGGLFGSRSKEPSAQTRAGNNGAKARHDAVTAEWIEYEIHMPGISSRTVRRPLFDLLGPSGRSSEPTSPPIETDAVRLERAMALLGTTDILVLSADLPDRAIEAQVLRGGTGAVQMIRKVLESDASDPEGLTLALGSTYRASSALLALASARRKWSPVQDQTYLGEVNILSQHRWLMDDAAGNVMAMEGLDIVANQVSSVPGPQVDPFRLVVQQGVLDTNAEAVLMTRNKPVANVALLHEAASQLGINWIMLQAADDPSLKELGLPDDMSARIRAELRDGSLALVPERAFLVEGESAFGWWKIDPLTGETLGMGPQGWGQSMVQRAHMEGTTRSVTPMWVKAFRATMDMFWCFVKETGSYIGKANASVAAGPSKEESEEYVVNSFACIWTMNCQFFDIGAVPVGAAVCEVVDQFLEALDELPE